MGCRWIQRIKNCCCSEGLKNGTDSNLYKEKRLSQFNERVIIQFLVHSLSMFMGEDIIYAILSRLPIKSLARFRCVCKLWLKYINDPYLHTIHIQEEPTPIIFQKFSLPQNKINISFLRGVQEEPVFDLCYKPGPYNYDHLLLGSCNGLTLVSYGKGYKPDIGAYRFAVINLVSKQRHDLPPIFLNVKSLMDLGGPCEATGIAFDDSTNTVKTVFSFHANSSLKWSRTMVHSSGTSSWRKIPHAYPTRGEGVFGHGRLHWLPSFHDEERIVWFDVKTEELGLMDPPPEPKGFRTFGMSSDVQLADLNGEVGFAYVGPIRVMLWILKAKEEWVLHCCFDISVIIHGCCDYDIFEVAGCWNKDGDILFTYESGKNWFVYTLKTGDFRQVLEHSNEFCAVIRMYRSSLFLLNTSAYSITQKKNKRVKRKRRSE